MVVGGEQLTDEPDGYRIVYRIHEKGLPVSSEVVEVARPFDAEIRGWLEANLPDGWFDEGFEIRDPWGTALAIVPASGTPSSTAPSSGPVNELTCPMVLLTALAAARCRSPAPRSPTRSTAGWARVGCCSWV